MAGSPTIAVLEAVLQAGTPYTSLPVAGVLEAVAPNEVLSLGPGGPTVTVASPGAAIGALSIPIASFTPASAVATGTVIESANAVQSITVDGADATGVTQATGGTGARGWLSTIASILRGVLSVARSASTAWSTTSVTQNINGNSANFAVGSFTELLIGVNLTAITGSVTFFLDSLGVDGVWYTVWSSASQSAVGQVVTTAGVGGPSNNGFGSTARLRWIVGGATPSFTFTASIIGK